MSKILTSDLFISEHNARHPVLLAVDQLQAVYGKTSYRDQHFVPIHSYHLSMPRLIMEYASGKRSFVRVSTKADFIDRV